MKLSRILKVCASMSALPMCLWAQAPSFASIPGDPSTYGPLAGNHEITLGGNGVSNKDMDATSGGISGSYGYYFSDTLEGLVRQSANYSNPASGGTSWSGSTFVALDQHFMARGALRPFAGVNLGRVYGDSVSDTWAGGLEIGVKFYVQPRTFIQAMAQYAWNFEDADEIDDTFSNGQFIWTVGIGFNF